MVNNMHDEILQGHRYGKKLTNKDYGTIAFLIDKRDIKRDKKENAKSFSNPELYHNCIYFLIGYESDNNDNSIEKMYVGKAGIRDTGVSVLDRLNEHAFLGTDPEKYIDKWTDIVVVTNRDKDAWGSTELDALEYIFWSLIPVGNRYNSRKPSSNGANLEKFSDAVNQIKVYLDYLGYEMFKSKTAEKLTEDVKAVAEAKSDLPVDLDNGTTKIPNITTPNLIVEKMLDALPPNIWNSKTKFLDPACKGGEYLRAIYKRLINNPHILAEFENDKDRLSIHILQDQLFGIALTQNSRNIAIKNLKGFKNNIRVIPGYIDKLKGLNLGSRPDGSQKNIKDIFNEEFGEDMKFNVVIGNPPYQESTGSGLNESGGTPLFDQFILNGINITNRMVCMITPTKWMTGNQSQFVTLRNELLDGSHLVKMVDYMNAKAVFPGRSIAGGVSYFLYDKNAEQQTEFITAIGKELTDCKEYTNYRNFCKGGIIPRHAVGEQVIDKIKCIDKAFLSDHIFKNKWNLPTDFCDGNVIQINEDDYKVITPNGDYFLSSEEYYFADANLYKVMFTRVITEHAVEPGSNNTYKLLSSLRVIEPNEICNASYMVVDGINKKEYAENIKAYLETKFVRFLILQTLFGIGLTSDRFQFVPMQDFTKVWTDQMLYQKYSLSKEEISFIETIMAPINITATNQSISTPNTASKAVSTQPSKLQLTSQDAAAAFINQMIQK